MRLAVDPPGSALPTDIPLITTRGIDAKRYANVFDRALLGYDAGMYIGVGAIVLILIIVLIVVLLRR